ncbi:MAG: LCP family protein [Clostridium sp.]|nr:LCP family protein [Clostridium sp.]
MNYDGDDELERMRQRRQMRREGRQDPDRFGYEDSRYGEGSYERGSRTRREAETSRSGRQSAGRAGERPERRVREGERDRARQDGGRTSQNRQSRTRDREREASGSPSFRSGYSGPKNSHKGSQRRNQRGGRGGGFQMDRRKKIFLIVGGVILALILFIAAAYAYVNHKLFGNMASVDFDEKKVENLDLSEEQLAQMKGHWMIACFGVDSREKGGEMNVGKGANADVNMICSVDLESGEIKLVSVFRDTYLNISDKNTYNKINAAYAIGGPEQAVAALNKNLDLNITQYATFNWKAVADAINILGGVDIELSENERSWINAYITETVKETGIGSHQIQKAGLVHMDGVQAVAYGRIRYGDTDYARTERQRIVLQAAFDKVKTADWATVNNVIQTVMPQLATNIDMADLIPLARQLANFHIGDTKGFPMARGEASVGKNGDCVIPQTLASNVSELHQFLFGTENYQPSSKVQSYSTHISEATGMYKEGKSIDHVPVDQGLNASSYVKAKQKRAAEKAAAEQRAKEEAEAAAKKDETKEADQAETQEETKDYFGNWDEEEWDEEDWEDFWDGEDWYEDWGDDGIPSDGGATGPGADTSGPAGGSGNQGGSGQGHWNQGNSNSGENGSSKPGSGSKDPEKESSPSGNGSSSGKTPGSGESKPASGENTKESVSSPEANSPVSQPSAPSSPQSGSGEQGKNKEPQAPNTSNTNQEAAGPGDAGPAGPAA